MSILDLSGQYENKRVISYKANGNTVVLKTIPLQLVAGNIYITRMKYDDRNKPHCDMYIWFPNQQVGILHQHLYDMEVTTDVVQNFSVRNGFDSAERYVARIQSAIEDYSYVSYAQIKLMEYLAPELVQSCRDARVIYDKRCLVKEQQKKRIREEEDAARTAKMNTVAATLLLKTAQTIQSSGIVNQEEIKFFKSRFEGNTYGSLFGVLASIYAVTIPINVLGWIAKSLVCIKIENGVLTEYRYRTHNSKTLRKYMCELLEAIQSDAELKVITKWLNEKGIACPDFEQIA